MRVVLILAFLACIAAFVDAGRWKEMKEKAKEWARPKGHDSNENYGK